MNKKILGKKIKQRREELGLSQENLAQKLGYKSRSTVNKIELGINDIPLSKLKDFADALKVEEYFFISKKDTQIEEIKKILSLISADKLNEILEYLDNEIKNNS